MSQHCVVPNWNQRHQRQDQVVEGEGGNRSPHVHTPMPRPNYEVAELIWENGQLAMNGLSGLLPTGPTKPTWPNRAGDTLESIVNQATWPKQNPANMSSTAGSSAQKRAEAPGQTHVGPGFVKKRVRSELDRCGRNFSGNVIQEERSACASANATFCKENDATLATWASFESPWSLKTKTTDEDSACQDGSEKLDDDQERKTKAETCRSHSTRRSRAAAVHNQSERRRRDRINEKMKALQKLVPNASKTDKASMLDEVIEYLKQLQAQVHLMSSARNMSIPMPMPMPHMMMPSSSFGMHHHTHQQQQIQMSLLARMGMGMGMGVGLGMGMGMHGPVPPHTRHPFVLNPMIQNLAQAQATTDAAAINSSVPFSNPYCAFLGQSMNMDIYNKMAAMYQQQVNQTTQPTSSPLPSSHVQGGTRTP